MAKSLLYVPAPGCVSLISRRCVATAVCRLVMQVRRGRETPLCTVIVLITVVPTLNHTHGSQEPSSRAMRIAHTHDQCLLHDSSIVPLQPVNSIIAGTTWPGDLCPLPGISGAIGVPRGVCHPNCRDDVTAAASNSRLALPGPTQGFVHVAAVQHFVLHGHVAGATCLVSTATCAPLRAPSTTVICAAGLMFSVDGIGCWCLCAYPVICPSMMHHCQVEDRCLACVADAGEEQT